MRPGKLPPILLCLSAFSANAEEDFLGSISLEDLLNVTVTVASGGKAMTLRESPGIVTLITKDEIANSGARDLIDVLSLVPGLSFGVDVQGVVGIFARGNWSHEGKISLMVDDLEMNELSFATLQFGQHFPVDNIERIELIRGPGSAIYGGFAEMGVIKIITKNSDSLQSPEAVVGYGNTRDGQSRMTASFATGKSFDQGKVNANIFYNSGLRSDRVFADFYGDSFDLEDNSDLETLMVNLSASYKDLSLRYLHDDYQVTQRDIFFVNAPYAVEESFKTDMVEARYAWQISEKFSLTPQASVKKQNPWQSNSQSVKDLEALDPDSYLGQFFDQDLSRITAKVIASYDFNATDNLIMGVSYYQDKDSTANLSFNSKAIFAQSLFATDHGNYTLGARWEDHSEAGSSFLPRLGYTRVGDKAHIKVLWSTAFRAPVVQNIVDFKDINGVAERIKPESTEVFEIEFGYKLTDQLFLTANVFDIKIEDPIVYYFEDSDAYTNYDEVGTRGVEIETRYKAEWGYLTANYSYYQVSDNQVDQYAVRALDPNTDDDITPLVTDGVLMGSPQNKVTLAASMNFGQNWRFNTSVIFEGEKYSYVGATEEDDQLIPEKLDSTSLLNFNFIKSGLLDNHLELQFGVFNLLDEDTFYVQPYYDGYHAPMPGSSRELFAKAKWRF